MKEIINAIKDLLLDCRDDKERNSLQYTLDVLTTPVTLDDLKPGDFKVGELYWQFQDSGYVPKQYEITHIRGKYFFYKWIGESEERCVHMDTIFAKKSEPENITLSKEYSEYTFISNFKYLRDKGISPNITFI